MRNLKILEWLALAALAALAIARASLPLTHDDLFGHLRTGEHIVEAGRVPLTDPFSFTRPGARWITHEWGFSLLTWGIWRLGGYPALIAARVLLILAIGWVIGRRAFAEADPEALQSVPWLVLLLGLGLWMLAGELILRAALVSELFLALTLLFFTRFRQTGRRGWLAAVAVLFLLWANLHSGVILGLFILGLWTLEAVAAGPVVRRWPGLAPLFRAGPPRPYLMLLGATIPVTLLNPNGWEVWFYPFKLSRILFASGIAWDLGHFAAADPRSNSAFLLLLVLLLAGVLPLRRLLALSFSEILGIATFLALSFRSPRFLFHVAILALPALYRLWAGRELTPLLRRLLPAGVAAALALVAATAWLEHPRRLLAPQLPEGAVRFLEAQGFRERVFNHQNYGGFLLWRRREPVFWDGRNDVFVSLVQEVTTTPFPRVVEKYGVEALLIAEHDYAGIAPEIPERWGLVYWDDWSAVYLRRTPEHAALLDRLELSSFPGFGGRPGLEQLARDPRRARLARAELDQVLAAWPENQRALYFRGVLSLYQGNLEAARQDLRAALAIRNNEQVRKVLEAVENAPAHP
ncbi:MAG TPA: hypothetical protein VKM72_30175 [Thermoanaerobaculia bacterium]|nr:hypothetical protein [Thermoanaerobaculia bacterium]